MRHPWFSLIHLILVSPLITAKAAPHQWHYAPAGSTAVTFNTTYLFTAVIGLGQPPSEISTKPITVSGGIVVPEPIINGTVAGPAINATITSGLATPEIFNNGTIQKPIIDLFGVTLDGFPFRLHETGVGTISAQITRIELDIGGGAKYEKLRNGYILATVNASTNRTKVTVKGYLVQNVA